MTPFEAANHYLTLAATDSAAAIRFAHDYEDGASPDDFDDYLEFLNLMNGEEQPRALNVGLFYAERMGGPGEPYIAERGVFMGLAEFIPYRLRGWEASREVNAAADLLIQSQRAADHGDGR